MNTNSRELRRVFAIVACALLLHLGSDAKAADALQDDAIEKLLEYQAAKTKVEQLQAKRAKTGDESKLKKGVELATKLSDAAGEREKKLGAAITAAVPEKKFELDLSDPEQLEKEVEAFRAQQAGLNPVKATPYTDLLLTEVQAYLGFLQKSEADWKSVKDSLVEAGLSDEVGPLTQESAKGAAESLEARRKEVESTKKQEEEALKDAQSKEKEAEKSYNEAKLAASKASAPVRTLSERLQGARKFRCKMAYCWGGLDGTKMAIEPVLDLPVGLVWAVGQGALPAYINSNNFSAEFNLGLRWWFAYDKVSLMVYISQPITSSGEKIRIEGSTFEHSKESIHRSYPSVGLGIFGDSLILGFSYDVLRNGSSASSQDPNYPPNEVLSRAATFTLAISPFNMSKNALGATQ